MCLWLCRERLICYSNWSCRQNYYGAAVYRRCLCRSLLFCAMFSSVNSTRNAGTTCFEFVVGLVSSGRNTPDQCTGCCVHPYFVCKIVYNLIKITLSGFVCYMMIFLFTYFIYIIWHFSSIFNFSVPYPRIFPVKLIDYSGYIQIE